MSDLRGVEVRLRHRIGVLELNLEFAATAPWTVLFGPSGSGKSTVLRVISGLARPTDGRVSVLGKVVVDTAAGVWVPGFERAVRWAGQQEALLPGRTVRRNMEMGTDPGVGEMGEVMRHFGLEKLAERRPGELSGGQRQRVSVARAAAGARGKVLLLDEPFTGMDESVRGELIGQLRTWLGDTPVVSVTHDVGEAFLLGAEVVRMSEGRVLAQGPVAEVLVGERVRLLRMLELAAEA